MNVPKCPKHNKYMDIKVAKEGLHKGQLFFVCPDPNCMVTLNYDLYLKKNLVNNTIKERIEKESKPKIKRSTKKIKNITVASPEKLAQEKEFLLKSCKERRQKSLKNRRSTAVYKYMQRF